MENPQAVLRHRVTYIANEEETPCKEANCDDPGQYMCGDCGQHACDFHFKNLRDEDCPDKQDTPVTT